MIDQIINGATNVESTIYGIAAAYTDVPQSLSQFPCFLNYPGRGTLEWPRTPSVRTVEHEINIDLLVQKGGDLSAADRLCKPYIDKVIETFDQNITLQGSCLTAGITDYNYGVIEYGGVQYIGIKFNLKAITKTQVVYKG